MVFVIAEIGVNWDGDFDIAKDMMKKAKEFGCNAVKFQAFKKEMVKAHPENKRLEKSAISESNVKQICAYGHVTKPMKFCTKCGTTFDKTDIEICPNCEPYIIKVAELEVSIEEKHKEKNRLKSHLKKHKLTKDEYNSAIESLDYQIDNLRKELTEIA